MSVPVAAGCGGGNSLGKTVSVVDAINAYPNPTNDKLTVELNSQAEGKGTLNIYDSKGGIIISKSVDLNKGFNNFNIETSKMTVGNYFLIIQNDNWVSEPKTIVKL